jgi:anti-sigma regulatory factor (Ser/Thr protein kinase)
MSEAEPLKPLTLSTRFPADEDAPRTARDCAADLLARQGVLTSRGDDVALVVSELVSNAVRHGPGGEVELNMACSHRTFRVEVSDEGTRQFEWPLASHGDHWGLELVRMFSDRSGIHWVPWTVAWSEIDLLVAPTG